MIQQWGASRLHMVPICPPNLSLLSSRRQFSESCCKALLERCVALWIFCTLVIAAVGAQSKMSLLKTAKAQKCLRMGWAALPQATLNLVSWNFVTCCKGLIRKPGTSQSIGHFTSTLRYVKYWEVVASIVFSVSTAAATEVVESSRGKEFLYLPLYVPLPCEFMIFELF